MHTEITVVRTGERAGARCKQLENDTEGLLNSCRKTTDGQSFRFVSDEQAKDVHTQLVMGLDAIFQLLYARHSTAQQTAHACVNNC